MQNKSIVHWIVITLLVSCVLSGTAELLRLRPNADGMTLLGYPAYLVAAFGFCKVMGSLAFLAQTLWRDRRRDLGTRRWVGQQALAPLMDWIVPSGFFWQERFDRFEGLLKRMSQ